MANINQTNPENVKPSRPLGVWILTIYALVFAGLAPLGISVFTLFSGLGEGFGIGLIWSIFLCTGVIISAINAWWGKEWARKSLIILVALNYSLVGINNLIMILFDIGTSVDVSTHWARVLRGILYPALFYWYFSKPTTKLFFTQE
jgi:hypothetical protein